MEKRIKTFQSFEEQEAYHLEQMHNTTPIERLRQLYALQEMTQLLHPVADKSRKILIGKWKPLN